MRAINNDDECRKQNFSIPPMTILSLLLLAKKSSIIILFFSLFCWQGIWVHNSGHRWDSLEKFDIRHRIF